MMTGDLSDIRARWAGRIGAPWSAEAHGSHLGRVVDAAGETIAETWCTAHDDAHGAEVARLRQAVKPRTEEPAPRKSDARGPRRDQLEARRR